MNAELLCEVNEAALTLLREVFPAFRREELETDGQRYYVRMPLEDCTFTGDNGQPVPFIANAKGRGRTKIGESGLGLKASLTFNPPKAKTARTTTTTIDATRYSTLNMVGTILAQWKANSIDTGQFLAGYNAINADKLLGLTLDASMFAAGGKWEAEGARSLLITMIEAALQR